jgi:hypothetical protein
MGIDVRIGMKSRFAVPFLFKTIEHWYKLLRAANPTDVVGPNSLHEVNTKAITTAGATI